MPITRTFTPAALAAIGIPDQWSAPEEQRAERLHEEQVDSRRWVSVHDLVFRAPDDGRTYAVTYEQGLTEMQEDTDPWNGDDTVTATAVEQREVTITSWLPVEADQPGDSDGPAPAWHWGADPSHGGQTRHKGARENCPAPDCEPEHPAAVMLRAAAAFVRLVAEANAAIGENRPLPREMQGRTRAEIARADMHPAVGRALADWLEAMAGEVDGVDGEPWVDHAVAVARAVLGKGDPT